MARGVFGFSRSRGILNCAIVWRQFGRDYIRRHVESRTEPHAVHGKNESGDFPIVSIGLELWRKDHVGVGFQVAQNVSHCIGQHIAYGHDKFLR